MRKTLVLLVAVLAVSVAAVPSFGQIGGVCDPPNLTPLCIKKQMDGGYSRTWDWNVLKIGSVDNLVLALGQSHTIDYDVTVTATSTTSWDVTGIFEVRNNSGADIWINSVVDSMGPVIGCNYSLPGSLPPTIKDVNKPLVCRFAYHGTGALPTTNTVTVYLDSLGTKGAEASFPITYTTPQEINGCISVTDTFAGSLGTVCAPADTTKTFTYSRTVSYDVCGNYEVNNTATITDEAGTRKSSGWNIPVRVPCAGGCTLTPGYWKTHSEFGPAPYDDTWAKLVNGASTPFFISGQSWYQVLWTPPSGGSAYYILAHAYIASRLNLLNGSASTPQVDAAMAWATAFFTARAPSASLSRADRNTALGHATTLDNFNNGLTGPGHCTEEKQ